MVSAAQGLDIKKNTGEIRNKRNEDVLKSTRSNKTSMICQPLPLILSTTSTKIIQCFPKFKIQLAKHF